MTDELMRALVAETARAVAAEFAKQAAGLQHLECLPLETLAQAHDIPLTTLHYARQAGRGPRVFSIGRRVYCLRKDWNEWLADLAATGGVKNLNAPRRHTQDAASDQKGRIRDSGTPEGAEGS